MLNKGDHGKLNIIFLDKFDKKLIVMTTMKDSFWYMKLSKKVAK